MDVRVEIGQDLATELTFDSFILEGILSVVLGALCFFALPDSPTTAKWLTPEESKFLELSHIAYRGVKTTDKVRNLDGTKKKRKINWGVLKQVVTDWQLYLQAIVFWSNCVPNYGLKFTMPSIIRNMGFESTQAQLLTAPPYICGAIAAVTSALVADKLAWRSSPSRHLACCVPADASQCHSSLDTSCCWSSPSRFFSPSQPKSTRILPSATSWYAWPASVYTQ